MYEIIVNKEEEKTTIVLMEEDVLLETYTEKPETKRLEGNIYLGKVQNVLPGMQAAFVDIGEGKNTFIHLKDLLPQIDQKGISDESIQEVEIKKLLRPGMPILVQVKRDKTFRKGARVSTHISLSGKYVVLMPEAQFITISQKIKTEKEDLIQKVKAVLPKEFGAIIRTAAEGKNFESVKKEIEELVAKWYSILEEKDQTETLPKLLYQENSIIKKMILDLSDKKECRILVNNKRQYEDINKEIRTIYPEPQKVEVLLQEGNLLKRQTIQKQLDKRNDTKIWLKCGGFITIEKTEALTAIDVNSGKYIGKTSLEDTVFEVNKEATIEIVKQLILKDIGGIIIIDYIDMSKEEHKEKIIELMTQELKKDRSKTQIVDFTKLNLLEMTRKHMYSE